MILANKQKIDRIRKELSKKLPLVFSKKVYKEKLEDICKKKQHFLQGKQG